MIPIAQPNPNDANRIPAFTIRPFDEVCIISQASTSLVTPTASALGIVVTAGPAGALCERLMIKAAGNTTAGKIHVWYRCNSIGNTDWSLIGEKLVSAITVAAGVASFESFYEFQGPTSNRDLWMPPGAQLAVTTHNAEQFNVIACGGHYA